MEIDENKLNEHISEMEDIYTNDIKQIANIYGDGVGEIFASSGRYTKIRRDLRDYVNRRETLLEYLNIVFHSVIEEEVKVYSKSKITCEDKNVVFINPPFGRENILRAFTYNYPTTVEHDVLVDNILENSMTHYYNEMELLIRTLFEMKNSLSSEFSSIIKANKIPEKYRFEDGREGDYYICYGAKPRKRNHTLKFAHSVNRGEIVKSVRPDEKFNTVQLQSGSSSRQPSMPENYILENKREIRKILIHKYHIYKVLDETRNKIIDSRSELNDIIDIIESNFTDIIVSSKI